MIDYSGSVRKSLPKMGFGGCTGVCQAARRERTSGIVDPKAWCPTSMASTRAISGNSQRYKNTGSGTRTETATYSVSPLSASVFRLLNGDNRLQED